jgi:hypothetical protein
MCKLLKSVVVVWLFTVLKLHGQISVFSADGAVSLSGWAQASPLVLTNYSMVAAQGSLAANADARSLGNGPSGLNVSASASSQGSQGYSVSLDAISWSSSLGVNTWSQLQDCAGQCYAQAQSTFQLEFGVLSPSLYQLTLNDFSQFRSDAPLGNIAFACNLASGQGLLGGWNYGTGPAGGTYIGLLVPGEVYTLTISMSTEANFADPLGELNNISANVELGVVPEPGSIWVFCVGIAILVLFRCSRRLAWFLGYQ